MKDKSETMTMAKAKNIAENFAETLDESSDLYWAIHILIGGCENLREMLGVCLYGKPIKKEWEGWWS